MTRQIVSLLLLLGACAHRKPCLSSDRSNSGFVVYAEPRESPHIVGKYAPDTQATVGELKNGWLEVTVDGKQGYTLGIPFEACKDTGY